MEKSNQLCDIMNAEDTAMAQILGEKVMANLLEAWPEVIMPVSYGDDERPIAISRPPMDEFMLQKPA